MGLGFEKIIVLLVIAAVVIGPSRLPAAAAKLAGAVKAIKGLADQAQSRMRDEMGPGYEDFDWRKLDPRQYDPRRIIRDALLEDGPGPETNSGVESTRAESDPTTAMPGHFVGPTDASDPQPLATGPQLAKSASRPTSTSVSGSEPRSLDSH